MTEPQALVAAFERIAATRMAGMPLCNPALSVEAAGFRAHGGGLAGVLVTPWSINLVLLPAPGTAPLATGERATAGFPSGNYEFMGGDEPECGHFRFCSLFSPPDEFADQAQARAVALEVMAQLFQPAAGVSRRALFVPQAAGAQAAGERAPGR
jgi:[NiFe] hydrogenase assembly HybE family chaperone